MTTTQEAFEKWKSEISLDIAHSYEAEAFEAGYAAAIAAVKENYADSIFGRYVYYLPEDTP